eukprot:421960_1
MSDVKYWESTYSKALGQFKDLIVKAEKSKQEVRDSAITDAAKSARRIDGIRRSYNLEVRLIKERMDKHIYQKDKDDKDKEYQALRTRMDDVKSKAMEEKKQLLVGSRPQNAGASEGAAADKTLDQADKIQDMTEKKYENMITIIQDTEEVDALPTVRFSFCLLTFLYSEAFLSSRVSLLCAISTHLAEGKTIHFVLCNHDSEWCNLFSGGRESFARIN